MLFVLLALRLFRGGVAALEAIDHVGAFIDGVPAGDAAALGTARVELELCSSAG